MSGHPRDGQRIPDFKPKPPKRLLIGVAAFIALYVALVFLTRDIPSVSIILSYCTPLLPICLVGLYLLYRPGPREYLREVREPEQKDHSV